MANVELKIKVAETLSQKDVGKNIAKLDMESMFKLGLKDGDLIEIIGSKHTAAVAIASQSDMESIIRIDGTTRKNSGASIGEEVTIKRAEAKEAKNEAKVIILEENLKAIEKKNPEETKRYILHQYLVLLTRGIHGTFIYAVDKNLREYLKSLIKPKSN